MATIQPRGPAADPLIQQGNQAVQAVAEPQTFKFDDGSTFDITGKQVAPATIPDNRNIPVAQVQPTTALTLPQPEQGPDLSLGIVEGARTGVKSVSDYIKELAVPESEASKTQSSILSKIQELIPQTGGRGQAQLDEEQKQGLPDLKASLASINAEILSKVAEFDKVTKDIEKNSNFKGSFSAKASELRRTYAAETGLLQARALGLQGQVQAAQETANRAVDLKYSTIEDNLRIYESQLRALEPILNKEEKEIALARQVKIEDDRQRIADQKEKEKSINEIMVQAAKFGADPNTLSKVQGANSIGEAIKLSGSFLSAEFRNALEQQAFDNNIKTQQIALSRAGLAMEGSRLALSRAANAREQAKFDEEKDAVQKADIANIIKSNPGQWGHAADLIEAKYGKIETGSGVDKILKAVYQDGANIDALLPAGDGTDLASLVAYAQQYASTGQIPTGLPKGTFGTVADIAKSSPQPNGTLVDKNTGVKSGKLNETQMSGITALYDINQKINRLKELDKQKWGGVVSGTLGKVTGSNTQREYLDLRDEVIDLLARARTGAALTASEEKFYKDQLPGRFSEPFGIGDSQKRIDNFSRKINESLQAKLSLNGLSIYGYSKVQMPDGKDYTVGSILEQNGKQVRVNPDGSLTPIN